MTSTDINPSKLYTPLKFGRITLANRIIMAPLARQRSDSATHTPTALMWQYYTQRASAGLIICEANPVVEKTCGNLTEPAIYNDAQAAAWKTEVTDRVHAAGSKIFLQLQHAGRTAPPQYNNGVTPVAPSAIASDTQFHDVTTNTSKAAYAVPRELSDEEAQAIAKKFAEAAARAVNIGGFDGVEIHGANGYLINQFLVPQANKRSAESRYAGTSIKTRAQFALDVVDAVVNAVGADRTGIRISPYVTFHEAYYEDPVHDTEYIAQQIDKRHILYVHVERRNMLGSDDATEDATPAVRANFSNIVISNVGYERAEAEERVDSGATDAVALGQLILANPDIVRRFKEKRDEARNPPQWSTFYTGGATGYTDYPFLD